MGTLTVISRASSGGCFAAMKFAIPSFVFLDIAGKTTLARTFLAPESENYFDLERPTGYCRLEDPETSLSELRGLVD
jgi:hypothetical protein